MLDLKSLKIMKLNRNRNKHWLTKNLSFLFVTQHTADLKRLLKRVFYI